MAEEVFCQALATGGVVGGDEFFAAVVDAEAGVFPRKETGEFLGADEFGLPRRTFGMVKTNWRWGTSWQTEVAIHSLVERTRR